MSQLKRLSSVVSVGGQLWPDDMAALYEQGFTSVINNRPDNEEAGQPSSVMIEAAASAAGLTYLHVPVHGMPDKWAVSAVDERLKSHAGDGGRTVMFCRSGMRSAATWAMAQRLDGADADDLRDAATAAGYDLSRLPL